MILTDNVVKALAFAALAIYAVAAALTITGRLGHWPLTITLAAMTISAVGVMYADGFNWHRDHPIALLVCIGFIAIAIWRMVSTSPWSVGAVIAAASLHALFLIAILLFLYFFRIDRLW